MNREDFKNLAECVYINNQVLQGLLILQLGDTEAKRIYKLMVQDVKKAFKEGKKNIKKEGKKNDKNN